MSIKFSIIIPTYNRAHLISKAIESVIDQTYPNWELVIVDDGSTDNTEKVVKSYKDDRIKYYWQENQERNIARNYGLSKALGDYIIFWDSDDLMVPTNLKVLSDSILHNHYPSILARGITIKGVLHNLPTGLTKQEVISKICKKQLPMHFTGVTFAKKILSETPYRNDTHFTYHEDLYMLLNLLLKGHALTAVKGFSMIIVNHPERSLLDFNYEKYSYSLEIMKSHFYNKLKSEDYNNLIANCELKAGVAAAKSGLRGISLKHVREAARYSIKMLFSRKLLAIIKNLLLNPSKRVP